MTQKTKRSKLGSERWTTVRDFADDGDGFALPKYEAKCVEGVDRKHVEEDLVLVKKTGSLNGTEHTYLLPKDVFEAIASRL